MLESAPDFPYVYYVSPLLRDSLRIVRDTAAEKEFDIAIKMALKYVTSEIQENRNGPKKVTFNKDL